MKSPERITGQKAIAGAFLGTLLTAAALNVDAAPRRAQAAKPESTPQDVLDDCTVARNESRKAMEGLLKCAVNLSDGDDSLTYATDHNVPKAIDCGRRNPKDSIALATCIRDTVNPRSLSSLISREIETARGDSLHIGDPVEDCLRELKADIVYERGLGGVVGRLKAAAQRREQQQAARMRAIGEEIKRLRQQQRNRH